MENKNPKFKSLLGEAMFESRYDYNTTFRPISPTRNTVNTLTSDSKLTEKLEEVMKDLEQKVNPKSVQEGIM